MDKRVRKVFTLLKTKAKALGFNRKELEGIAVSITNNLSLADDASDEDEDAAIGTAVDAALPFLQVSQSAAQRSTQQAIQRFKERHGLVDDDDDDDEEDDDNPQPQNNNRQRGNRAQRTTSNEESELMKLIKKQNEIIEALNAKINSLQGDRVTELRRNQLKKLVGDTGTFGKSVMKQFEHMQFKDDESFADYLDDVQKDLDDLNQERANEGLNKLGQVPTGQKKPTENKPDALTDAEIIALAGGASTNNKE